MTRWLARATGGATLTATTFNELMWNLWLYWHWSPSPRRTRRTVRRAVRQNGRFSDGRIEIRRA